MVNIRVSQFFAYAGVFIAFLVLWEVAFYLIETLIYVLFVQVLKWTTVPLLDLPTPISMLLDAIENFPDIYRIGTTLFWGFVEELAFIAYILSGMAAALLTAPVFGSARDFFKTASEVAGLKAAK